MISQNIHRVANFKVEDIKEGTSCNETFYTRKILVIDNKGNELELTMFSDDRDTLIPAISDQLGY
tara:strand:+ start:386 stop:580 length:195 start_codon:yes stop_codon:yes gene_type:complete